MSKTVMSDVTIGAGRGPGPLALAAMILIMSVGPVGQAAAQLDEGVLKNVCRDESNPPAPDLAAQCDIFDLDGPNRTTAANGNNLGITGAQGRAAAQLAAENVRERLEELREGDQEGGGAAADWMIGRLGVFIAGDGSISDRDTTLLETGYDATSAGVSVGADYRLTDSFVLGVAFSYNNTDTDFVGGAGDLDSDAVTGTLYASITPNENFYLDAYVGYAGLGYDGVRNIAFTTGGVPVSAVAATDTDGDQLIAGAAAGYDFYRGAWSLGPYAQFDYSDIDIDAYTETGGSGFAISYGDQSITSIQSVLGVHASYAASMTWGVLVPDARVEWVHEFDDDSRAVPASFVSSPAFPFTVVTDDSDANFGRVGLSLTAILPGGIIPFADYEYQFGHSFVTSHSFSAGFRIEF